LRMEVLVMGLKTVAQMLNPYPKMCLVAEIWGDMHEFAKNAAGEQIEICEDLDPRLFV
jgi:hypothetical protein